MIAGLLDPTAGGIHVGGRDMVQVPAHQRNIGLVFQDYALFPHLTVAKNVAFGLEMRGLPKEETRVRVAGALELVGLSQHAEKRPSTLSGGERQRVALARALAIEPQVLLLDEPLSNLDARLRHTLREELRRIHDETGITTVFVTHDQAEALSIADRIVVMSHGRVHQDGPPKAVYERPATRFVANFLGDANVLPGFVDPAGRFATQLGQLETSTPLTAEHTAVMVRPEHIQVRPETSPDDRPEVTNFAGRITTVAYLGSTTRYRVALDAGPVLIADARNTGRSVAVSGDRVLIAWRAVNCVPVADDPHN
jgi:putative spermidine/putrescine transport system ATP-binding protein